MDKRWNKKILVVLMQYDYGIKARGLSADMEYFCGNLKTLAAELEPFFYDAYLEDLPGLQTALLKKAADYKPDLIFFLLYTDQFKVETLDQLKSKYTTCAWFGDDTWRFEDYSSKMAPHFTIAATTDPFSLAAYRKIGVRAVLTQWAAQQLAEAPVIPPDAYDYDVSFLGGYNRYRAWFLGRLEKLGVRVSVFGPGWPAGKVSFEEMNRIFLRSRINLNLSNSVSQDIRFLFSHWRNPVTYLRSTKRAEQIKARNFEIPVAGGFQLTNYAVGLERYFRVGEEVAVFSSPEECAVQIAYYMEHEDERLRLAAAGHVRAAAEHTYEQRMRKLLESVWDGPALPSAAKMNE
ncbi:MAG: glycosyltransferase [Elusimicrobia bacterium]|nr:glycosyltransferase [Elusimicrobiota bacterium]